MGGAQRRMVTKSSEMIFIVGVGGCALDGRVGFRWKDGYCGERP